MATCAHALIADRFLLLRNGLTLDLASGEEMWIRIERVRSPGRGWAERCAALYALRHPCLVELADFGLLGRAGWFEAFRTQGRVRRWPPGRRGASRALQAVAAFLVGQGLSPGRLTRSRIIDVAGEPRILPDDSTGLELEPPATREAVARLSSLPSTGSSDGGIVLQSRTVVEQIADFLEEPRHGRARWLHVRAPVGSGVSTTLRLVARDVRVKGFLPLSASLIKCLEMPDRRALLLRKLLPLVGCRHLVVLNDHEDEPASPEAEAPARLVSGVLALRAALPHADIAVVSVSNRETPSPWVALDPLRTDQLLSMVGGRVYGHQRVSLLRAAHASCGWPGRFVKRAGLFRGRTGDVPLARERAPRFAADTDEREEDRLAERTADLDAWRCLIDGRALMDRGRHAAAARAFRAALGMFERRDDQLHAGTACHELGLLLALRGAIEDACRFFAQAGRKFREVGAIDRAIAAAAAEGSARIDAGELRVAEALLQTAEIAELEIGAGSELLMLRAALIRCLHVQGRFDDALRCVERNDTARQSEGTPAPSGGAPFHHVQWHCAAASLAVQRRAFEDASAHVTSAISASKEGPPLAKCAAHTLAVSLYGLIGDAEAVQLHAGSALEAARAAHAPVEALRVRVTLVGALADSGATNDARAVAARLLRRRSRRVPPLLAAQRGMVLARALPDSTTARVLGEEGEKFARASGAAALVGEANPSRRLPRPLDDIVDLLKSTHEYEDEDALLAQVTMFLRDRLGALTVAFYSAEDLDTPIVSAGSGRALAVARAVRAGILLGPLRTSGGIEMAAPIRCGGTTIGGLGCRWSASGPTAAEHARTLIATAAAMCSPFCRTALDRRRAPIAAGCPELLGVSQAMIDLRYGIVRAAAAPFPVLIVGESGVGKELVARAIHRESPRRLRNFAALNCAALAEELAEAELFGHARGAFTGAIADRRGLFEEADGGTLFLDEVSELSPRAQAKLLRVLQEGEVRRVGESFARHVEVRIVAATNRGLEGPGPASAFRHDLRYRLDVIRIEVPPLRERIEDIPVLASAFWTRIAPLTECRARLSPATLAALACHDWPGNVRELQNVISALAVAAPRRGLVGPSALPAVIARTATVPTATRLEDARLAFERRCVGAALARAGGKSSRAAKELGISRQGLAKLMKRVGIAGENTERRIQNTEENTESGR